MNNIENGLVEEQCRPAYITNKNWERMKIVSPIDLAMMSIEHESHGGGNVTLWRVLRKHPEVLNQKASNGRTLLFEAMCSCQSNCMYKLVEFGAQFGSDECRIADRWDASQYVYANRKRLHAEAKERARFKYKWVDGAHVRIPIPEGKMQDIHPLLK